MVQVFEYLLPNWWCTLGIWSLPDKHEIFTVRLEVYSQAQFEPKNSCFLASHEQCAGYLRLLHHAFSSKKTGN